MVTYAQSTEYTCPDNATLNGTQCYCNKGYVVSGNSCVLYVPPPPPPPPANAIYQDVLMSLTVNDDKTCDQLFTVKADIDMCTTYRADTNKANWTSIQRPTVMSGPAIANPWAPASQQTFSGSDTGTTGTTTPQVIPAIAVTPPPPPPAPDPTPTPDPTPPPPPPPSAETDPPAPDANAPTDDSLAQALANATPVQADDSSSTDTVADAPPAPAPEALPQSFPQIAAAGASQDAVQVSPTSPGLSPLTDITLTPDQTIPDDSSDQQPGFFARIFNFLFGWL